LKRLLQLWPVLVQRCRQGDAISAALCFAAFLARMQAVGFMNGDVRRPQQRYYL